MATGVAAKTIRYDVIARPQDSQSSGSSAETRVP
jgi:hypothetical protein